MAKYEAYTHKCVYCGSGAQGYDHKVPIQRGGNNRKSNLVPACNRCNSRKGNKTPEVFRLYLGLTDGKMPVVFWNEQPPEIIRDYLVVISRKFKTDMLRHNRIPVPFP